MCAEFLSAEPAYHVLSHVLWVHQLTFVLTAYFCSMQPYLHLLLQPWPAERIWLCLKSIGRCVPETHRGYVKQ